jgi:hypothetical protein
MKRIAIALALAGASCAALALLPSRADADDFKSRGCGWPLLLSSEGPANVQGPDDAAYEVVHKGAGYDFEVGEPLPDAKTVPDRGANPFVRPGGNPGSYTVESRAAISSRRRVEDRSKRSCSQHDQGHRGPRLDRGVPSSTGISISGGKRCRPRSIKSDHLLIGEQVSSSSGTPL